MEPEPLNKAYVPAGKKNSNYEVFRESRPKSVVEPLPQPKRIFKETCTIVDYRLHRKWNIYVLNFKTSLGYPLSLIPNPFYTDDTPEPWELEKNYIWVVTYSGDPDTYRQIQTMTRSSVCLYPSFFKYVSFL